MKCLTFCISRSIDLKKLEDRLKPAADPYKRYPDYIIVTRANTQEYIYYFQSGTVVMWNIKRKDAPKLLAIAEPYTQQLLKKPIFDGFSCRIGGELLAIKPHGYFNVDLLVLPECSEDLMIAASYGFSRSVKLRYFEALVAEQIDQYNPLFTQLAQNGKIKKRRADILKIIGKILQIKSLINLKADYSALPSFFWHSSNLEEEVLIVERYLDIPKRVLALNQKIDILNDNFQILNNYLEEKHSHFLEWVIIILIAVEIFLDLVK